MSKGGELIRSVIIIAAVSFLIVLLLVSSSALSTISGLEAEAVGALQLPGEQLLFRAYRPQVTITVGEAEKQFNNYEIIIRNINTALTEVTVTDLAEGREEEFERENSSPTEILLKIKKGTGARKIELHPVLREEGLTFALVGDNQGRNQVLETIIEEINGSDALFLIHLGDLVPSGTFEEYEDFLAVMSNLEVPFYTVPGNHDVRGEGKELYQRYLSPLDQYFDFGEYRFVFLDSSSMGIKPEQWTWLEDLLDGPQQIFVAMHVPAVDPRGKDHAFLDKEQGDNFLNLIADRKNYIKGVFNGHIHIFDHRELEGVHWVTSGGGGASLYAAEEDGGFHHYTLVTIGAAEENNINIEAIPVDNPRAHSGVVISGKKGDIEITHEQLLNMATVTGESKFENMFNNFRGEGTYRGILIRDMLKEAGGISPGDILTVHSRDGYRQVYAYDNIDPRPCGWDAYQGEMILAVEYNGETIPDWQDGYRIVFLPDDGEYSNEDCERTSAPGQGFNLYPSAGSRWVKYVYLLEVGAENNN